jgi:N-acetylated-alpha-linked acidic dipeptidase
MVLLGTHHDAWTFGGVDPGSTAAALLELARVLAELGREGWRPRRTLQLAFWDAEEFGLIGSTEYAEQEAPVLRERAVAYLNSDLYRAGRLEAKGAAAFDSFVGELARDVARPGAAATLAGDLEPELPPLGSGADFVPFQMLLGLPALSFEFGPLGGYGSYHSAYDTRRYMERFGDPGWAYGRALVELLGRAALRLANAEALPLRPSSTARAVGRWLETLEAPSADLAELRAGAAALEREAVELEAALAAGLAGGGLAAATLRGVNDALKRAETAFADGEPQLRDDPASWYRHELYGWDIYALYAGDTLPSLRRALKAGDRAGIERGRARLEQTLARVAADLERARASLDEPPSHPR